MAQETQESKVENGFYHLGAGDPGEQGDGGREAGADQAEGVRAGGARSSEGVREGRRHA